MNSSPGSMFFVCLAVKVEAGAPTDAPGPGEGA